MEVHKQGRGVQAKTSFKPRSSLATVDLETLSRESPAHPPGPERILVQLGTTALRGTVQHRKPIRTRSPLSLMELPCGLQYCTATQSGRGPSPSGPQKKLCSSNALWATNQRTRLIAATILTEHSIRIQYVPREDKGPAPGGKKRHEAKAFSTRKRHGRQRGAGSDSLRVLRDGPQPGTETEPVTVRDNQQRGTGSDSLRVLRDPCLSLPMCLRRRRGRGRRDWSDHLSQRRARYPSASPKCDALHENVPVVNIAVVARSLRAPSPTSNCGTLQIEKEREEP